MPDLAVPAALPGSLPSTPRRNPHDKELRSASVEVRQALRDLVRVHQSCERELAGACGLTPAAAHALQALALIGDLPVGQLAKELVVERSTASRLARGLEKKGYLEPVGDARDRRIQRLRLTTEGREVHRAMEEEALGAMDTVLASFGPSVRRSLAERMRELTARAVACRAPERNDPG
jgi:DNA-binding MarR family transcriptional regulator